MWLTSEHAKYGAEDTIELTVHSAYYDSLEDAEKAMEAWVTVYHGDYYEIEIAQASNTETSQVVPDGELPEYNDWRTHATFTQLDPENLVIQPRMGYVTRKSLPHSFTVTIKIKEDAPESFSDTLTISARSDLRATSTLWSGVGRTGVVFVTVERNGDTVKLYAARDSTLGKHNYR